MVSMASQPIDHRILLVGPTHRVVRKAVAAGWEVVSVIDPRRVEPEEAALLEKLSAVLLRTDLSDEAAVRRALTDGARSHRVARVLHPFDDALTGPVWARGWELGLTEDPPAVPAALAAAGSRGTGGQVVVVQTQSAAGRHDVVGLAARRPTGYVCPAPLPGDDRAAAERVAVELLESAGLRSGPAHVTVELAADGPRVLRAAAGLAPHRLALLLELSGGLDPESVMFRSPTAGPLSRPPARRCAEIGFFRQPAGRLTSVAGIDSICALPYVQALSFPFVPGEVLVPSAGHVMVTADSPEEAAARVRTALGLLVTTVESER